MSYIKEQDPSYNPEEGDDTNNDEWIDNQILNKLESKTLRSNNMNVIVKNNNQQVDVKHFHKAKAANRFIEYMNRMKRLYSNYKNITTNIQ